MFDNRIYVLNRSSLNVGSLEVKTFLPRIILSVEQAPLNGKRHHASTARH